MVGQQVARLRKERGWTQAELAARTGLSRGFIAMLETGQRPDPGLATMCKFARAFKVSLDIFCPDLLSPETVPEPATVPA
jgi:transcriptional regulator with XRE-family HTH domain